MNKILGERRSGKTTKLINQAAIYPKGYAIITPNYRMAINTKNMAKQMGIDVDVITFHEFIRFRDGRKDKKYLIDELDMCLEDMGVVAYTNGND